MISDIHDAIRQMEETVALMDGRRDRRAVFLYAYLLITYNVRDAIRAGWFFDGDWLSRLAGKFARLYFESLEAYDAGRPLPEAWRLTHDRVLRDRASVVENLLLGVNAHINYDLAFGIAENILEHNDQASEAQLLRRKFDHDRVNEVLARATDQIQVEIPRRYGGLIPILDVILGRLDEYLALAGLRAYRENVWSNVRYLLLAGGGADRDRVVAKVRDEAVRNAQTVIAAASPFRLRFARGGEARRAAAARPFAESPELASPPFEFDKAVAVAAAAAVPTLAGSCVIDLADSGGLIRRSVVSPDSDETLRDESRGEGEYGSRLLDDLINTERGEARVGIFPLTSPGGVFGCVTLTRGDAAAQGGEPVDAAAAEEYARLAAAAIETAAAGHALREECARMRDARARSEEGS